LFDLSKITCAKKKKKKNEKINMSLFFSVHSDVTHHQPAFSTHHALYVSIYDRSLGDTQPQQSTHETCTSSSSYLSGSHSNINTSIPGIEGVELFLGETEIKLDFENLRKAAGWVDQWYP
jgi:hypothetical protein